MVNWPKILTSCAIVAGCVLVLSWMLTVQSPAQTEAPKEASIDSHPMNADGLEHEVRSALPAGSSVAAVQEYLTGRGLEFSFDAPSKTVFAMARKLQGSTSLVNKSLAFKFRFDDGFVLTSINVEVLYTGP